MSGHSTPDGDDDPDDGFPAEAGLAGAEADPRLAAVSAWLASAPLPPLPDGIEARISAALEAEAQARTADRVRSGPAELLPDSAQATDAARAGDDEPATGAHAGAHAAAPAGPDRTLFPAPARARVRRSRSLGRRLLRSGQLLLVVLALAGTGFLISRTSSSSSSSSAAAGPAAGPAHSTASAAVPAPAASASRTAGAAGTGTGQQESGSSASSAVFTVAESGISYRRATLAQQVAARVSGASSSAGEHPPSAALSGCVLHFTGGGTPALVDQATYQGTPVYVVASASRVWVVGRGCTATKTELIVSVPLAG